MTGPLEAAARVVGDRWNLLICDALVAGPLRFADLQRQVTGVSATVLSRRLRDLEGDGVLVAEPYSQRPRRHRYRLTDRGRALAPALAALARWGEELLAAGSEPEMVGGAARHHVEAFEGAQDDLVDDVEDEYDDDVESHRPTGDDDLTVGGTGLAGADLAGEDLRYA